MRVGGQDHHHSNLQTCPHPLSNYTGEVYSPFKYDGYGGYGYCTIHISVLVPAPLAHQMFYCSFILLFILFYQKNYLDTAF